MRYIQLGNLVELKQGMAINAKSNYLVSKEETPLALLRIADMPTKSKVIFMSENTPKRFIASEDDIIYTRTGQVGLVFRKQQGVVHNNCFRVIPNSEEKLDKGYLYWYLSLNSIRNFANSIASGSAQPDLPHSTFKKIRIWLPHITSQKKIAKILDQYELLIENNNKRIKLLEQMAENLYKEWFVRFRFPGYENEHFIEDIPSSWSYVQLGDIASFDRGISYSSDEINCDDGINLINLKNVQSYGGFRRDGTKQYNGKYKDSQIVVAGDLILGVTDMTQDRRTVGSVALIPQLSGTSVISADLVKVNLKVPNVFFYCMCRYGFYSKYFSQFANGANVLHLKPNVLLNKKILLPIAELIEAFAEKVQPMIDIMDDLNCQNDLLTKQRDLLLPRLMSGKLEV
ncbi:restriction endonuclease subunit S [Leptotrichia sp. oral taxon 218]|uniref:restriction endonuclease subunit S n=1 Tax=Leptotrichia sp. oral taxon 218 TaxID=712361 RepID=UPI0021110E9E|nr:restriction endonuclease subunit S [Leptotrichia sp. oral taxon 218]